MNPVSIVIPFYNDDKNFEIFFNSNYQIIKKVNIQNEIIAIDDTKNVKLLTAIEKMYPDVRLISHSENKGFAFSVNEGVEAARHEIVFLFNSDILMSEEVFKYTPDHFNDNKMFAVTFQSRYRDGKVREGAKSLIWKGGMPKIRHAVRHYPKPDKNGIIHSVYAVGGHCAVRKSMYLQLNGMDYRTFHPFYWEDSDLGIRALKKFWKIIYEPKAVVVHPQENSSIISNFKKNYISEVKFKNRVFFTLKNYRQHILKVRFFLVLRFIQKAIKTGNIKKSYQNTIGLISEFNKLTQAN